MEFTFGSESNQYGRTTISLIMWLLILYNHRRPFVRATTAYDQQGPTFSIEPPYRLEFTSNVGSRADCTVRGNPTPNVEWLDQDNNAVTTVPKVRHILSNGSLYFPPFEAGSFRQDVHWAIYKCIAGNSVGTIISRDLSVKAVVNQRYDPEVQNPAGFIGSNVLLKCNIPLFVREYVTVTSWLQEPSFNIYPSMDSDGKYHMLPTGELLIINISHMDVQRTYRCRTHHQLTQEAVVSGNVGRIQLTEMRESVPPIMNEKLLQMTTRIDEALVVPCVAYASPSPSYRWHTRRNNKEEAIDSLSSTNRIHISDGTLVIVAVQQSDAGTYYCTAKNVEGSETLEVQLTVTSPLTVHIQPARQTIDLGKSADLMCSATGFPRTHISWLKDGQQLRISPRVRLMAKEHIRIISVTKEDRGMYQCFVKNDYDSVQAVTELRLGVPPKITPFGFERDLNVGDRTSIQCVVTTGDLPLLFIWLKDNVQLTATLQTAEPGVTITIRQNDEFTSSLSIMSVTRAQGGQYTCRVQNDAETVEHSTLLRVNVPPRISPFNFENDITEGMRTQLMCTSGQGDQPFNITWMRDRQPIIDGNSGGRMGFTDSDTDIDRTIQIIEYAPFSSILTIHNLTSTHNGNYTCEISNRGGVVEYTATLSVAVPPRWVIEPIDESAVLGNSVHINCKADGFPVPLMNWKQAIGEQTGEYRDLKYSSPNSGLESLTNGSLIISKVSEEHEGNFLCQASNGIGAGLSKLIRLTVHVGPNVVVRTKQIAVRRGDRVTLRCEASGDQPLDVTWRAKGNRIDPTYDIRYHQKNSPISSNPKDGIASEFTIVQTALTDCGEYSCVATNAYGHSHAAMHLQVQEPPTFPRNLHVTELSSRSVLLAWSPNQAPNESTMEAGRYTMTESQPISNYILQFKESQDVWHEHNNQKMLPGDKTVAMISSLRPATGYHFRLYAENHLGTSAPSDILFVQTDGEVPGGPPTSVTAEPIGAQQLLVTWRPPEREQWNGELLGYTIGYENLNNRDEGIAHYNYTRVGIPVGDGVNDFRLTGLEKYTKYSITVQAINAKGGGPASEPIVAHTLEDVPSAPPQTVSCLALTSQNVQVEWLAPPVDRMHGIVQGYKLLYEPANWEVDYGARETKITSVLSTVLHGLQPYTNYTVQVLAFTRAGEGVPSPVVACMTDEAVPDAPERVKSVVNSETSVIISWLPPRRPNGIVTKYTIFIRIMDRGHEVKIFRETLIAQNHHYEAKDLNNHETYEAWVTASTRIGQGPSTPVIKLLPSVSVPASIISFGQSLSVSWRVDVKLPCLFVGMPKAHADWKVLDAKSPKNRLEIGNDNSLTLRNVQRNHGGNYTCMVRNAIGSDHIVYQLLIQVPPDAPVLSITSTTFTCVTIEWHVGDTGGSPLRGFMLTYRREYGNWDEIVIDRRINSYMLENLLCGTRYQFTLAAYNKIGSGTVTKVETVRTKGNKPIQSEKAHLIRSNVTSVILDLASWQDGGCKIIYFTVEFRRDMRNNVIGDWIVVSSNVTPQTRFPIPDLEPATLYNLRLTAHNNAGSTIAEYSFETLSLAGTPIRSVGLGYGIDGYSRIGTVGIEDGINESGHSILMDSNTFIVLVTCGSLIVIIFLGGCFCMKFPGTCYDLARIGGIGGNNNGSSHQLHASQIHSIDGGKTVMAAAAQRSLIEHRDQYYATVRKPPTTAAPVINGGGGGGSPSRDSTVNPLERIPEYSEDIYPYATFHLPDQENMCGNPSRYKSLHSASNSMYGDSGETIQIKQIRASGMAQQNQLNTLSGKRTRRKLKTLNKSESEEYDSLNSDTESGSGETGGINSRTESLGHMLIDESTLVMSGHSGPVNFINSHAYSPGHVVRGKDRLTLFTRSVHHIDVQSNNQKLNTSTEKLHIFEAQRCYNGGHRLRNDRLSVDLDVEQCLPVTPLSSSSSLASSTSLLLAHRKHMQQQSNELEYNNCIQNKWQQTDESGMIRGPMIHIRAHSVTTTTAAVNENMAVNKSYMKRQANELNNRTTLANETIDMAVILNRHLYQNNNYN